MENLECNCGDDKHSCPHFNHENKCTKLQDNIIIIKEKEERMYTKQEMVNCMKEYYKQGFIDYREGLEADPNNISCIENAINIGLKKSYHPPIKK